MLREYQLTNFKAFAGPETIPIRPITLIYGPNSSGKSSILQSLLLLKQTLEEANSSTPLLPKGKLVDLGDYREFVHRHDVSRKFAFRALFTLDAKVVKSPWVRRLLENADSSLVGLNADFAYDEKTDTIVYPSVDVFVGDKLLPLISYSPGKPFESGEPLGLIREIQVNREHSFWRTWWTVTKQYMEEELEHGDVAYAVYKREVENDPFQRLQRDLRSYPLDRAMEDLEIEFFPFSVIGHQNFLPVSRSSLPAEIWEKLEALLAESEQARRSQNPSPADSPKEQSAEDDSPFEAKIYYNAGTGMDSFEGGLDVSPITFQVCSVFRQLVRSMIYLGPLRSYPERYYTLSGNVSEYVGQSGEMLPDVLFKKPELLDRLNVDFARLGFGYELKLSVLDENSNRSNVFALRVVDRETGVSASIRDVGFGISQVLPVIVQSRLSFNKTLLIEQPEIHLHPAHQAELGDVFIQSALGEQQNTFLLETHSEHLMLRILRRIRETTEGELEPGLIPIRPEQVAVLYVLPDKDSAKVIEIPIRPDGEFAERWPQGFFAERAKELF